MLANLTASAELLIREDEAALVIDATEKVLSHYDFQATQKTADWIQLALALGQVYGTRAVLIVNRKRQEAMVDAAPPRPIGQTTGEIVPLH